MRSGVFSLALAAAMLLTAGAAGAATLAVTNDAALEGSFGMKITYNGSSNQVFVQDNTPESEPTYNFEFRHNFNGIVMPQEATQQIMLGRSDTPRNDLRVFMWCRNAQCQTGGSGQYNLVFQIRRDSADPGSPWDHCARISAGPNANVVFRVEVVQGTGSNDGICRVFRNGTMLAELTDMQNDEMDLDAHRWGGLAAVNTAITGFTMNDSFVSTR
jgi:hypothetical protein